VLLLEIEVWLVVACVFVDVEAGLIRGLVDDVLDFAYTKLLA
jgi:hypothetical protein